MPTALNRSARGTGETQGPQPPVQVAELATLCRCARRSTFRPETEEDRRQPHRVDRHEKSGMKASRHMDTQANRECGRTRPKAIAARRARGKRCPARQCLCRGDPPPTSQPSLSFLRQLSRDLTRGSSRADGPMGFSPVQRPAVGLCLSERIDPWA